MTIEDIKKKIDYIREISRDDEFAHSREDDLYLKFVRYVSRNGSADLKKMAREILKTQKINFARWCA